MTTRQQAKEFTDKLQKELKALGDKLGYHLELGKSHYGTRLDVQLIATPNTEPQEPQIQKDFKRYAPIYGLQPQDLGREILVHGKVMTLVGINPRATKTPLIIEGRNGKLYRLKTTELNFIKTKEEIQRELDQVESDLEPENLTRDGEATTTETKQRRANLLLRRANLLAQLDAQESR